jgi:DNA transformation protein and related proteins
MPAKSKVNEGLVQFVIEQLATEDTIVTRPLFGAIALYRNGQVFAMAWKGSLYFKVDEATRKDYEAANSHALGYVSEGVDHSLKSFWEVLADVIEVLADVIEDREALREWAGKAYEGATKSAKS